MVRYFCYTLYNKKDPSYKDLIKRENSWKTIAELTEITVHHCQTRWTSLRDRYGRGKKKAADAPSGSGAIPTSENSQSLLRSMSFLETIVQHRKTNGNYASQSGHMTDKESHESETTPIDEASAVAQSSSSGIHAQSSCSTRIISNTIVKRVQKAFHDKATAPSQSFIRIAPPLSSPVANSSPSPIYIPKASTPVGRFRTISSSDREESSSSNSFLDPSLEDEILSNKIDYVDPVIRTSNTEPKERKLKRVRNDEVNTAIINALGSLTSAKKPKVHKPPQADQLFAQSIVAELQRFPPRKRTFTKGELMQLLASYDETELE